MDVAVYNARIMGPAHVANVADLACRSALAYHGVAHITVPVDIQEMPLQKSDLSDRNIPGHSRASELGRGGTPDQADLTHAARILNEGRKVMILAGRGAIGAGDELETVAEALAAPIGKPLLGKMAVPDDSPYTTGGVGLLGTLPSEKALKDCDTLLIVGSTFPYIEFYPKPGQARCVQIEIDPRRFGLRYPVNVSLLGDAKRTLAALIPMLKRNEDRSFLKDAQDGMREWQDLMHQRGTSRDAPMKPEVVAHELNQRLKPNAIIAADTGTLTTWYARHLRITRGQMCSVSGNLATMANGLPYAIAAQIAYPERQVIAFVGDGGFTMLMGEMATCVKYKLPIKIVIIKNNSLGMIKWEQIAFLGNPEFGCELQPIDFAAFARACGAKGYTIDDAANCGTTLDQAFAEPGPVIIEAVVDPNEPPRPPKAKLKQIAHFAEAIIRGTPHGGDVARTILSDNDQERCFAVVLETGEEATEKLLAFAKSNAIDGATFTGIGAFSSVVLGFFDLERKEYERIKLDEQLELVSLIGNFATQNGEAKLHCHVVVANRQGQAFGGHLLKGYVRPTLEAVVMDTPAHLRRKTDPATGLPLLTP
jgi:pyruvate dehydrogenase (quinone)/pyruvate oxidase